MPSTTVANQFFSDHGMTAYRTFNGSAFDISCVRFFCTAGSTNTKSLRAKPAAFVSAPSPLTSSGALIGFGMHY
jgi:hypothetical protein